MPLKNDVLSLTRVPVRKDYLNLWTNTLIENNYFQLQFVPLQAALTAHERSVSDPQCRNSAARWLCSDLTTPSPSLPPAQKVAPFYEEWWFLVVVALVGLIFILLLVFILIIRGQSKKYAKKSDSGGFLLPRWVHVTRCFKARS